MKTQDEASSPVPAVQNGQALARVVPRISPEELAVLSGLALGFVVCLISLAWNTGVTVDEPAHFLSGRLYWEGRDNLHPGDMPPLIKIVSGWVPRVMGAPLPPASHEAWKGRDEWVLSLVMMETMSASDVRRYFFAARLPMLVFPLGCCLLIWFWGRQVFPPWAAVAAAGAFCLSPTVLGHGPLVKNDLAASFGYLLFWYRAWRYWREPHWRNASWLGAGLLCGVLAKYSLVVLVPVAPLILVGRYLVRPGRPVRDLALSCAACAVVVYAGMVAAWQLRMEPVSSREFQAWEADPSLPKAVPKAVRVASMIPLPAAFWRGGVDLISSNSLASAYFLGHTVPGGHPLYFLVALAVKTPIPTQILWAVAMLSVATGMIRRRLKPGDWCWLVPGFLYLGLASLSGLQLGVRLVLPALAFFIFMTGRAFELGLSRRSLGLLSVLLLAGLSGRTALAYPNYISFFNLWGRDSWQGLRILSDSNIDWGQDLRALAAWYRTAGIPRFTLSYFGTENVFAYFNSQQVEYVRPPWNAGIAAGRNHIALAPGYYAISATLISGQLLPPEYRDYYAAFRRLKPVDRAGNSIFIFRFNSPRELYGRLGSITEMNAPDASEHLVRDISQTVEGGAWRWARQHPQMQFFLETTRDLKLSLDFSIAEATFRDTGPVTLTYLINGRLFDKVRYDRPGGQRYVRSVPESLLRPGQANLVEIEPDKVWTSPEDGAKLSIILIRAGFVD